MKGFYVTLILFSLLLSGGIINFLFINGVYDQMNQMIAEISEMPCQENEEKINKLDEYWKKSEIKVSVSVNFITIDEIGKLIDSIEVYNRLGDKTQLSYCIALLKNAVDNVRRLEQFSIKSIL